MINNLRILITGATGFIGGRIVERLVFGGKKNEIIALARDLSHVSRIARFSGVNIVKVDVLDLDNLINVSKGCDAIFHCAYGNRGDEKYQGQVTVEGTRNVCEAALKNNSKLIYLSTVSIYGDNPPSLVDENTPFGASNDAYAESKIKAEKIVWDYMWSRSLLATIIRPTIVYGPYSPVWTINPINEMKQMSLVLIDHGNGLCNPLYVDNLVDALFASAVSGQSNGQAYIISDGAVITWKEFYSYYKPFLDGLGIENGWISMSKEELLNLTKIRKSISYNLKGIIRTLMTNESVNKDLNQFLLIRGFKAFAKKILPMKATEKVREMRMLKEINPNQKLINIKIDLPNKRDINFFSSKVIFSIKKAEAELGYKPGIDINGGMSLIKEWYTTLF